MHSLEIKPHNMYTVSLYTFDRWRAQDFSMWGDVISNITFK